MNKIIGLILVALGIAMGAFLGLYICLYGGIMQVVDGIKASFDASQIAMGIVRILITSIVGWVSALILILPGWVLLTKD